MFMELQVNYLTIHSLEFSAISQIYKNQKGGTHFGTRQQQVIVQEYVLLVHIQQLVMVKLINVFYVLLVNLVLQLD